jgi:hypothetical protein
MVPLGLFEVGVQGRLLDLSQGGGGARLKEEVFCY